MQNVSNTENMEQIKTHKSNSKPWPTTTASVAYVNLAATPFGAAVQSELWMMLRGREDEDRQPGSTANQEYEVATLR